MSVPRNALFALCIVLFGAIGPGGATAQDDSDKKFDLKPLIPPVFKLPPNSQVTSGALNRTPIPSDPVTPLNSSQTPATPGMRITIPTSPTR